MNKTTDKELKKIIKAEKTQANLIKYMIKIGRWLLFIFPLILVIITLYAIVITWDVEVINFWEQNLDYQILMISYLILIGLYFLNSIILLLGAFKTNQSLSKRLEFERKRGRPIDSLDGFKKLSNNVMRVVNLLKVISLICITSVVLFLVMLTFSNLTLGYAAMSTALVGLGLALLVKSLNLNIHDVNGLQDFFKPTTHQIFIDNFFAEIFSNHLDPVTYLKWDEFVIGISKILNPNFVDKIQTQEENELPITFALEKILFLYYLSYQGVLNQEQLVQEFKEVINIDSEQFSIEKGLFMDGAWYFSTEDIYKLFNFIKDYNPGFFKIIDRLQLELADNITRLSKDKIYMDSSTQEVVYTGSELNIMVFLYNNNLEAKKYRLRIAAPGFEPSNTILKIEVEGRGKFEIPDHPIVLTTEDGIDITEVLSNMLENGDTVWLTLEPREKGEQTIQIFLENEDGTIVEGKTRTIKVTKNLKDYLKKLSSLGSFIGGIGVVAARLLSSM
ncbi:MAG: hypothetical protein KGD63_11805 [Candidatus Lokiarchaeota archaeon]|nr:hypothetical protein [Candidatus Lokiarchaeota archaeon]